MTKSSRVSFPKVEERTLYPPIIQALKKIGFGAMGETKVTTKHPDIIFNTRADDPSSFVVEVKIGKPDTGLKAVAQASDYARKLGTDNIIILIYPENFRNRIILEPNYVEQVALNENVNALVLTEFWTESLVDTPTRIFQKIKSLTESHSINIDFKTIVALIRNYVMDLDFIIHQVRTDKLVEEVVDKLDLFSAIGDIKDRNVAQRQVINLASYLLFNQLLFYHVYTKKAKAIDPNDCRPDDLDEISSIKDVQRYFDQITDIDYEAIYAVNILGHVPEKPAVVQTLNNVIKSIRLLRAEHITQDLAGRFFHELIPFETRKVLAAFYTHPIAAEILAGLSIDSWKDQVIDPSCGSGTLLVSAYIRKMESYVNIFGFRNVNVIHKQYVEHDITGIDIMPFAAHITTLNLSTQNISQKTNIVRIACRDSLGLSDSVRTLDFIKNGIPIASYNTIMQRTLYEAENAKVVKKEGALSPRGAGAGFILTPVDVVIMNPPFSDRNKMPPEMRDRLKENSTLTSICGNDVNLWGYFLALSDFLLRDGGRVAAVIPVNIARGDTTKKIRTFLFNRYAIEYVIKPVADFALSEGASFKDVLFIARKTKPENSKTRIVFLKKSIRSMKLNDTRTLVSTIKNAALDEDGYYEDNEVAISSVNQTELMENLNNLMPYFGGAKPANMKALREFIKEITKMCGNKLANLEINKLKEGITSPRGLGELVYLTRPLNAPRIQSASLILSEENPDAIKAEIKRSKTLIQIPKEALLPALRTLTGIRTIDASGKHDFITVKSYPDFEKVLMLSKWKGKFEWDIIGTKIRRLGKSHLVIPDKIRISSDNTFMLGVFSDSPLILTNMFYTYNDLNEEKCRILSLSLNSVLTLAQFILLKSETLGGYTRLSASDWSLTRQLNYEVLSDSERSVLLDLFNDLSQVEFPSLIKQLETNFWGRRKIDMTIMKILGFPEAELIIQAVYHCLLDELRSTKNIEA